MHTLHVHNHYRLRGGEDVMFGRICAMLRAKGHRVTTFERRSAEIGHGVSKVRAAVSSAYSFAAKREMHAMLRERRPDVVHVH
ncbi:MAG: glycosyltransferase family 4 protein, partial [Candidatus Hydrogenedentes bacterium]|nr:glycosyltransferase family 4 protein [Candidatus Hydrogenedentota bacterium]